MSLEPGEIGRRRLPAQPALQGLVEALDLALGLGVARRPVLLADAQVREQVLEAVATAGEARRVDRAIVREGGGGPAISIAGGGERGDHVIAGDPPEGGAGEQVPGMVVEPADDLDLAPVGEAPVREVGLPDLVGRRGLEPDPGAARALARLGHDEAGGVEDAPDGRGGRNGQAVALQVPRDGRRARVKTTCGELDPETDDPATHLVGCPVRARAWPPGPRLEVVETTIAVPPQEAVKMPAADPLFSRRGGDGQMRCNDLKDGHPML